MIAGMNGRMELLFLLLVITRWIQQSDSEGWSSEMLEYASGSGIETLDFSFESPDGALCNLSVTTSDQCLLDIKLRNISCATTQDSASPITTVSCMNQTVSVEYTKKITIKYTQTDINPTTVTICPTPSPSLLNKDSQLILSSCPVCTPNTVTATIYQQPPIVLSGLVQVSILVTSGVLICFPILAIVIVAYCWVRTRRTLKKKRGDPEIKFVYLAQDSFHKSPSTHNDNTVTAKEIDTPLYTHEEKTTPAEKLKPITVTEPKPPRRPSNGPVYATPWSLKKKSNKESKKDKHGASREKSGRSVSVGVASQDKSLELKEGIKENFYVVEKENERTTSANKRKLCEYHYDEPIVAAKGKENEKRASATKQKVCEHQYDKPVIAAKPKKLQSKKGKGVDSGGKEKHMYHVLEGPIPRDVNNSKKADKKERKEDHKYHVLEGPISREECNTKKPDKQEGGNVYHVLEGPTPREGNSNKKLHEQEGGNVYHVLEGPTPRDDSNDRNPDKQTENVYHVLEGPAPRDENHSKHLDEQNGENVYHVLEGPAPRDENNPHKQKENVYHVLEGPAPRDENNNKNPDKQNKENIYHVLEGPTPVEDKT